MTYCDTCGSTYNQEQNRKKQVVSDAIKYAKDHQTEVAVYQEDGEWKFGTVVYLRSAGIPFREVYSQHT